METHERWQGDTARLQKQQMDSAYEYQARLAKSRMPGYFDDHVKPSWDLKTHWLANLIGGVILAVTVVLFVIWVIGYLG